MTILSSKQTVSVVTLALSLTLVPLELADARRGGFLSALLAGGRVAGAVAGAAQGVTKSYGGDTLIPSQLEACVFRAKALDENKNSLVADASSLERESKKLELLQSEIEVEQTHLQRTSQAAVDRFNARIDTFNHRIGEHRLDVSAYEAKEANFNLEVNSYNVVCAKSYYVDDMQAIKTKLGL